MSEPRHPDDLPPAPDRTSWIVAGFAAALHLALVVAVFGFVSLLSETDVVTDPAVGVLVAPVAVGASTLAVLVVLGLRLRRPDRMAATVALSAAGAWLAFAVVATVGHILRTTGNVLESVLFGLGLGGGWVGLAVAASGAIVAVAAVLVARGRRGGMARPRWPWERDDE
ncbi:hypothetical protein ET445_07105 [Agromyces protaetiae]|uniref:Uncharacterized protein n=1 Tax=Agromyces protaetiae TaxID=2509455 RepID=A0A4P6FAC2_9MICO|nr:DUF6121 family protein [Agromyces protaetiae]QAY73150.1 hypothetical protein ET445_07105 [Agromyces protaetiae]